MRESKTYVPKDTSELLDYLGYMLLSSPKFEDKTGYLAGRNLDTTFYELNEGLKILRPRLGEELYAELSAMSEKMRVLFEADPEDKGSQAREGRVLIREMEKLLRRTTAPN